MLRKIQTSQVTFLTPASSVKKTLLEFWLAILLNAKFWLFLPREAAVLAQYWGSQFCLPVCPSHMCYVTKRKTFYRYFDII